MREQEGRAGRQREGLKDRRRETEHRQREIQSVTHRQTHTIHMQQDRARGKVSDTQRETTQMERLGRVGNRVGKGEDVMSFCHGEVLLSSRVASHVLPWGPASYVSPLTPSAS